MVNSIVVVAVLSYVSLSTMISLTLRRLSYVYIGTLMKSFFFFQPISLHSGLYMPIVVALLELLMMHMLK